MLRPYYMSRKNKNKNKNNNKNNTEILRKDGSG
jgi:hypothetical protein